MLFQASEMISHHCDLHTLSPFSPLPDKFVIVCWTSSSFINIQLSTLELFLEFLAALVNQFLWSICIFVHLCFPEIFIKHAINAIIRLINDIAKTLGHNIEIRLLFFKMIYFDPLHTSYWPEIRVTKWEAKISKSCT